MSTLRDNDPGSTVVDAPHVAWSARPSQPLSLGQFGLLVVAVLGLMLLLGSLVPGGSAW